MKQLLSLFERLFGAQHHCRSLTSPLSQACQEGPRKVAPMARTKSRSRSALGLISELGSESSAHGLSRIVTSEHTGRRVIWSVLVICSFTAATVQLVLLGQKYLAFQVVEVSKVRESFPIEFPSVTVCSIEPISWRKIRQLVSQNESQVLNWLTFVGSFEFGEQNDHLNSIRAFYENLGQEADYVRHEVTDFVVQCRFNQEPCSEANFTTSFDGNYYSCFTFNGGREHNLEMHSTGPRNGLSLVISLDNEDPPKGAYGVYQMASNILHSAGARIVLHAPNTMPSPVDHGFDVPPGYSSSVGFKATLHTRLSYPYGNCTTGGTIGARGYKNTFFTCLQTCKQRIIIARCGCRSSGLPEVEGTTGLQFCGTVPDWRQMLANKSRLPHKITLRRLVCEERVLHELANDRGYEVSCQCFQPCQETSYQKSLSLSYWPTEFYQFNALQQFYGPAIEQSFLLSAYRTWQRLTDVNDSAQEADRLRQKYTDEERSRMQLASDAIRQNLLRLNVYLEELSVVEFKQLPAYDLADLFADIGGTLGLWMGISVLTMMELVELVLRLIFLLFDSEQRPRPDLGYAGSNGSVLTALPRETIPIRHCDESRLFKATDSPV